MICGTPVIVPFGPILEARLFVDWGQMLWTFSLLVTLTSIPALFYHRYGECELPLFPGFFFRRLDY